MKLSEMFEQAPEIEIEDLVLTPAKLSRMIFISV